MWQSQFLELDMDKPTSFNTDGVEGGYKLFAAILNRAIRDYIQYVGKTDSKQFCLAEEAWLWIMSDSDELTTFVWICKLLDQDPSRVRGKIAKLVENEGIHPGAIPITDATQSA